MDQKQKELQSAEYSLFLGNIGPLLHNVSKLIFIFAIPTLQNILSWHFLGYMCRMQV